MCKKKRAPRPAHVDKWERRASARFGASLEPAWRLDSSAGTSRMCNLYSVTRSQEAIRGLTRAMRDTTGNLPPLPAIFPDIMAPVVRTARDGVRELAMMRWGF